MNGTRVQPISLEIATSTDPDPVTAAASLLDRLGSQDGLYAVFVTAGYPRAELARALWPAWGEKMIGCTSAGNIGPQGFSSASVLAIAFRGPDLQARTVVIEPLSDLPAAIARAHADLQQLPASGAKQESFGLLLVDGLSMMEEHLAASLKPLLGEVPLIGGSAGDDLAFSETSVLFDGQFSSDRATVTIVSTAAPFQVFRLQHYEPRDTVMVITAASPEQRVVHEINGMPAAEAFAEAIGIPVADLGPEHFSANPVLLRAGGQNWVRSISRALPDGSLQFFAAITTGAVLRLGRSRDAERLMRDRFTGLEAELGGRITGLLTCDCILRRIEITRAGLDAAISGVLSQYAAGGFSTYGEQFDDFHMNQTMVGVAFGGPAAAGD